VQVAGFIHGHAVEDLADMVSVNGSQLMMRRSASITIDARPNVAMMEYALGW